VRCEIIPRLVIFKPIPIGDDRKSSFGRGGA
jgi:hypothetical protein